MNQCSNTKNIDVHGCTWSKRSMQGSRELAPSFLPVYIWDRCEDVLIVILDTTLKNNINLLEKVKRYELTLTRWISTEVYFRFLLFLSLCHDLPVVEIHRRLQNISLNTCIWQYYFMDGLQILFIYK